MTPRKKRHHYVWQYYLSAWSSSGRVQCWKEEKVFPSGTRNLGLESYFYEFSDLKPDDEALIIQLINVFDPLAKEIAEGWFDLFTKPSRLVEQMGRWPEMTKRSPEEFLDAVSELEEEIHTQVEREGKPFLDQLRDGQVPSPGQMAALLPFLTTQYTRTKALQQSVTAATDGMISPVWQVMRHVYATTIAMGILRSGDFKCDLLAAPSGQRFITGDQPVVNMQGAWVPSGREVTQLEFYYPVSPMFALVVGKRSNGVRRSVSEIEMGTYNATIATAAYAQVYAQHASDLAYVASDRSLRRRDQAIV